MDKARSRLSRSLGRPTAQDIHEYVIFHDPNPEGAPRRVLPGRNFRNRNKGCAACVKELEAEGYYKWQEQKLKPILSVP